MADVKQKYPSADTVAIAIALASLASDTNMLAGRGADLVDNTANLDIDHLLSGRITVGSTVTAGSRIEIWVACPRKVASGAYTWPDGLTGADANKSMTSANVRESALRLLHTIICDNVANRSYDFAGISLEQLLGSLPPKYVLWVVHNTGSALNATSGNHEIHITRVQKQVV